MWSLTVLSLLSQQQVAQAHVAASGLLKRRMIGSRSRSARKRPMHGYDKNSVMEVPWT